MGEKLPPDEAHSVEQIELLAAGSRIFHVRLEMVISQPQRLGLVLSS